MTPEEIVADYLQQHYRIVVWPQIGDIKGPREEGWPHKQTTLADYHEGFRVGLLTGVEISPGKFLHDVDIDWAPGSLIAQKLLPPSDFIFGRNSKRVSHCFYTTTEALPSSRYEDIDKTCLIELRGTKISGDIGLQTMVPPSVWTKETLREPLTFVKRGTPGHVDSPSALKQAVCLSAIGMLLAKHLGKNGFGHEPRLAWAGYLLRAGIPVEELIAMGEVMSVYTNNLEVHDIRRVVESTAARLSAGLNQKIKGGPAFAKLIGAKGRMVIGRINEWLGRDSDFLRNTDGLIIKDSQDNIRRAINLMEIELSYNTYAEKMLIQEVGEQPKLLSDHLSEKLWLRIDKEFHFRPTKMFFDIVIRNISHDAEFHPVRDYLSSLTWDEQPRIDHWLEVYGGAEDSEYLRAVSAIVLIAAVKRIFHPGCKYDEMLVLESQQGMNKSTALRSLCPVEEWFSDNFPLNVDSKQIIECTLGKWIIEASDLTGGRKADRDHLKSMLSRPVDGPARMAYAHIPVERPRQFILIGTTNNAAYLPDMTGARRFWPVKIQNFDVAAIVRDRDQLWAEAVVREARGEGVRLPQDLWNTAAEHQEARREIDAWESIIAEGIEVMPLATTGRRQITTATIWNLLQVEIGRRDRVGAMRISEVMQKLGYHRTKIYEEGKTQAGYVSNVAEKLPFEENKE